MPLHLNISGSPACGRLLSGHRPERAQDQATMLTADWNRFQDGLSPEARPRARACRWCARSVGLLPPMRRSVSFADIPSALDLDEEGEE